MGPKVVHFVQCLGYELYSQEKWFNPGRRVFQYSKTYKLALRPTVFLLFIASNISSNKLHVAFSVKELVLKLHQYGVNIVS